ncbi:MAG: hypothetical protein GY797_41420 [Deltaproteobacteria bacterium]|nr:hypothetical protein [Deltaproteobacteria bacterium]
MISFLRSKSIFFGIIILISIPIFCCLSWVGVAIVRERSHDIAIQQLSDRLNIPPSWSAFEIYLFDNLEVGMSKEQVYAEFDKISPYHIQEYDNDGCEIIKFRPGILNISSYILLTCYDETNTLSYFRNDDP